MRVVPREQGRPPALRTARMRVGRQWRPTPVFGLGYRVMCSPALAEMTGEGRWWTVSMISALSMPCR